MEYFLILIIRFYHMQYMTLGGGGMRSNYKILIYIESEMLKRQVGRVEDDMNHDLTVMTQVLL